VLLIGGDKTGAWNDWYVQAIPAAERLWDDLQAVLDGEEEEDGGRRTG
jgi:hypothetical protein